MTKVIVCSLAVYDAAHLGSDGTFWACRSSADEVQNLSHFYNAAVTAGVHRAVPKQGVITGGICVAGSQCAVFRVFDGGHDERMRPGRVVVAFVIASKSDILGQDLQAFYEHQAVLRIGELALRGGRLPPHQPGTLLVHALECKGKPSLRSGDGLSPDGSFIFFGERGLSAASYAFANMSADFSAVLEFSQNNCQGRLVRADLSVRAQTQNMGAQVLPADRGITALPASTVSDRNASQRLWIGLASIGLLFAGTAIYSGIRFLRSTPTSSVKSAETSGSNHSRQTEQKGTPLPHGVQIEQEKRVIPEGKKVGRRDQPQATPHAKAASTEKVKPEAQTTAADPCFDFTPSTGAVVVRRSPTLDDMDRMASLAPIIIRVDEHFEGSVDDFAQLLSRDSRMQLVNELDLSGTNATDQSVHYLTSNTSTLVSITHLDLSATFVSNASASALARMDSQMRRLLSLSLANTSLTDEGVIALAATNSPLCSLRKLDLDCTRITGRATAALTDKWSGLVSLESLGLESASINDADAARIVDRELGLKFLKELNLRATRVTPRRLNEIEERFPALQLHR